MPTMPTPTAPNIPPVITDISGFGKGAIPAPPRLGAEFKLGVTPSVSIIWDEPFRVPVALIQKNQNGSQSCTAQAVDYYCEALDQIEDGTAEVFSPRHIYSQTFLQGGGAYIRDAMRIPIVQGLASANSVPIGNSSEAIMTNRSDNFKAEFRARTDKYAAIPDDFQGIEYLAQICMDYKGFVTGFNGWNGMFSADGTVVNWSRADWGHCVYVNGFEIRNGVKCLSFRNSWGGNWGDGGMGYFPEAFVNSGFLFDAHVYADVTDLEPTSMFKLVQVSGDKDVYIIKNGTKTLVFNKKALLDISEFSAITAISQKDLDAIPLSDGQLQHVEYE